jgi:uncharacterized small protein (DUF1192 family)
MSWWRRDEKLDDPTQIEKLAREIADDIYRRLHGELSGIKDVTKLAGRVATLRQEVEKLTIERDRKQEEYDRREREIEHKVGLERKRQEFEITQAKRETTVVIREENLAADKQRFEEQMAFHQERFEEEVKSLRKLVNKMMERLPSAEIIANFGGPQ